MQTNAKPYFVKSQSQPECVYGEIIGKIQKKRIIIERTKPNTFYAWCWPDRSKWKIDNVCDRKVVSSYRICSHCSSPNPTQQKISLLRKLMHARLQKIATTITNASSQKIFFFYLKISNKVHQTKSLTQFIPIENPENFLENLLEPFIISKCCSKSFCYSVRCK